MKKTLILFLAVLLSLSGCGAEESATPSPSPVVTTVAPAATRTTYTGRDYVLNTNTMKFHYPECHSVKQIKDSNRQDYHGFRSALIDQGYSPCGNCKP